MLSRAAENIFWLNRYLERADNYARFIDVNLNISLEMPPSYASQWLPLVETTGDTELFHELYKEATAENVIRFLATDTRNPNSIRSCLNMARENARIVREIISIEMWEAINALYLWVQNLHVGAYITGGSQGSSAPGNLSPAALIDFFKEIRKNVMLFYGTMEDSIAHGEAWHFGRLGRFLERADKTARILDMKYFILLPKVSDIGTSLDQLQWAALLKSTGGLQVYRRQYGHIDPHNITKFLIFDRQFPRAIKYCLIWINHSLHELTDSKTYSFSNPAEKKAGSFLSELDYKDYEEVRVQGLHEFLDYVQQRCNEIGGAIGEKFF
ncbi:MAG: alpha-E domain-containing protein [Spirochaetes bacterium]|nr:alpha-E domain-containing protein [Spirochaetota bacterium]